MTVATEGLEFSLLDEDFHYSQRISKGGQFARREITMIQKGTL